MRGGRVFVGKHFGRPMISKEQICLSHLGLISVGFDFNQA